MQNSISVIVPAYNEEARIVPTLERLCEYLGERFPGYEIIVVDDGSTDNTSRVVKNLILKSCDIKLIQSPKNMGKGHAVKTGVLASKGGLVLICDADLSTPVEEVEKLGHFMKEGFDIAIGSRGLRDSDIAVRQPWHRERMGKIFNVFVRNLVMGGIRDTQCGFKLFRGDVSRELFAKCRIHGFSFDVEVLFLAEKAGYKIKEVPIRWLNSPHSRVTLISDPVSMFLELFRIRLNWLLNRYNNRS